MNTKPYGRARFVSLAVLSLGALLAGCASNGARGVEEYEAVGPVGVWSPHARARFITIDRSTTYTIVRTDGRDLLVIEEGIDGALSNGPDRFVWIVSVPHDAPIGSPVAFTSADDGAWLLEYRAGMNTHAQRVAGSVTVIGRTEDALDAQVELVAPGAHGAPGQLSSNEVALMARLDLPRYQAFVPATDDPLTRSGTDGLRNPNPEPRSKYGTY